MFIEAKDDGSGGDNWSYKSCKAPVKSSPPTNQQTNTQFFTGRMPFLLPNQQCQSTERGKISHSMNLLTPSSPGGLPTLSVTTNSSWLLWGGLPCLSSALWYQYPIYNNNCYIYSIYNKSISLHFTVHSRLCRVSTRSAKDLYRLLVLIRVSRVTCSNCQSCTGAQILRSWES